MEKCVLFQSKDRLLIHLKETTTYTINICRMCCILYLSFLIEQKQIIYLFVALFYSLCTVIVLYESMLGTK